jgi:Zn-dependent protease
VATILNGDYARVVPLVSSFFTIKDFQRNASEGTVQFLIAESGNFSSKFQALLGKLGKADMVAFAKRSKYVSRPMPTLTSVRLSVNDGVVITVARLPKQKAKAKNWLPVPLFLFMATVAVVFFDGLFVRSQSAFANEFIQDPFLLTAIYTLSLMGILGIHELGHMLAARKYGIRASWPYFIPGVPGLIPTFGAMIQIKSNMTSRNVLFDVGIAGPLAGLIVTVIVSIYGSSISVLIPADQAERLEPIQFNLSLLMLTTMDLTGNVMQNTVLVMSPVLFAAWIGFLITFLNLLPAWQLDGGHLARSALGVRPHRVLTYASVAILFVLRFYPMALLVLFFSMRAPESTPLDDVTPLSQGRKALFVVALGLAVLCAPIPSEFVRFLL